MSRGHEQEVDLEHTLCSRQMYKLVQGFCIGIIKMCQTSLKMHTLLHSNSSPKNLP